MGPEFHAAGKRLKDFERKFCSHSPAVSAAECLKEMVGMDHGLGIQSDVQLDR